MGGLAIAREQWYMRNNWTRMCIRKSLFLSPLQSTIFVDDTFDYNDQILEEIPFGECDPSRKPNYRSSEELTDRLRS